MTDKVTSVDTRFIYSLGTLIHEVSGKLARIEDKVDKLETKIEQLETKLDNKLEDLNSNSEYLVDRFKEEPFLCDPYINKGDIVSISLNPYEERVHRVVKRRLTEGVVVIDEGKEVFYEFARCQKVGHSPALKYFLLQDIKEAVPISSGIEPIKRKRES